MNNWKTVDNRNSGDPMLRKTIGKHWVSNFHLMCSKDNEQLPKYRREFFDNPLIYDVNGTRTYVAKDSILVI